MADGDLLTKLDEITDELKAIRVILQMLVKVESDKT